MSKLAAFAASVPSGTGPSGGSSSAERRPSKLSAFTATMPTQAEPASPPAIVVQAPTITMAPADDEPAETADVPPTAAAPSAAPSTPSVPSSEIRRLSLLHTTPEAAPEPTVAVDEIRRLSLLHTEGSPAPQPEPEPAPAPAPMPPPPPAPAPAPVHALPKAPPPPTKGTTLADAHTAPHLKTGGETREYTAEQKAVAGSLDPECERVYKQLKIRRKHRFLVMRIDPTSEAIVIETIGARDAAIAGLGKALPFSDCRYAVYDHEYKTYDGRLASRIYFITWLPRNATPQAKMGYTTGKRYVRDVFTGARARRAPCATRGCLRVRVTRALCCRRFDRPIPPVARRAGELHHRKRRR